MKPFIVFASTLLLLLAGCHNRHNTSINVKENSSIYQFTASFSPNKTSKVQHYLDIHLASSNDASFVNTEMDATITLHDETRFHIKSYPGFTKIKFNKHENSADAYDKMKGLYEGIKPTIN